MSFVHSLLPVLVGTGLLLVAPVVAQVPQSPTAPVATDTSEEWSPPVNDLRGRLEVVHDTTRRPARIVLRIILENVGARPLSTTNQPDITGALYDAAGKRLPLQEVQITSRFVPRPQTAVIPGEAQIRFTPDGGGFLIGDDTYSFFLPWTGPWTLKPGRYTLKATLHGTSLSQSPRLDEQQPPPIATKPWKGTLVLPPVTFAIAPLDTRP